MVDYELLRVQYFQNEIPCPYELKGGTKILIYPINVEDYYTYIISKGIMEINKNDTQDVSIISMSYLEFLYKKILKNNQVNIDKFLIFLRLILHEDYINIEETDKKFYLTISKNTDDGYEYKHIISSKELEEISKISFFQNDPDYDDTIYNPEIKKAMEDYYKLKYRGSSPSLEKQKAYVISKTGFNLKDINKMIYRTFNFVYHACIDSEIYLSQQILKGSYRYEIKEPIIHPLFEKPKSKLNEVFSKSAEELGATGDKIH